jgi:glycosyltransferase involved in cell wall biosynthesis
VPETARATWAAIIEVMHICYVIPAYHASRDDIHLPAVVDTIERISAVHDVTVICLRQPPRQAPFVLAGARVITLGHAQSGGVGGRARVLGSGVTAVLRRNRQRPVDIVHGLWADEAGAVATIAARLLRRPSVVSVMGGELVALADIGYGAALGRGGRLTAGVSLRLADEITAQSSPVLALVHARGRNGATRTLPLGVDRRVFHPRADGDPPVDKPRVLYVGNLIPVKDPLLLVRAFARVAVSRPNAVLDIVGDGNLRAQIENTAAELGVAVRIALHGQLLRPELAEMYRSATVLAIPSRYESQSVVAVEAVASGLPVVGTRVGILPDLGEAALVVPVGDEAALAGALAQVLDDPDRAASMRAAGRDVAAHLDLDVTAADLLRLYWQLDSRRQGDAN